MSHLSRPLLRFWLISALALLAVAVTASLGRWQLARAAQKEALQERMVQQSRLPVLAAADVLQADMKSGADAEDPLLDRRLQLSGHWLPEYTLLLDNRPMNGKQGFFVLTPLKEVNTGQVVMVQRGWIQRDFNDRERVQPFDTPSGRVLVTGRLARAPSQTLALAPGLSGEARTTAPGRAPQIRQNLSLGEYRAETQLPLWDHLLLQTDALKDGLQRDWPAPHVGVDKHHGYAFQWFGLSALITLLYVWFQLVPRFRPSSSVS